MDRENWEIGSGKPDPLDGCLCRFSKKDGFISTLTLLGHALGSHLGSLFSKSSSPLSGNHFYRGVGAGASKIGDGKLLPTEAGDLETTSSSAHDIAFDGGEHRFCPDLDRKGERREKSIVFPGFPGAAPLLDRSEKCIHVRVQDDTIHAFGPPPHAGNSGPLLQANHAEPLDL